MAGREGDTQMAMPENRSMDMVNLSAAPLSAACVEDSDKEIKEVRSSLGIEVLLASEWDTEDLNRAVAGTPWTFVQAKNVGEVAESVRGMRVPIVLLDLDFPGGRWIDTLRALRSRRRGVCVIVLASPQGSPLADRHLRAEVAKRGGFDVLMRPLERADVLSMLVFAYAQCRISWTRLPRANYADVASVR